MIRKRIKGALAIFAFAAILFSTTYISATSLEDIKKEQQEIQKQQEEIKKQQEAIKKKQQELSKENEELSQAKKELENSLGNLNSNLYDLSSSLEEIQSQTETLELEIQETTLLLEETEQQVERQYEDMKLRIQYMYENSKESPLTMLFEAGNFAEFLNRLEYIAQINSYDREMLVTYQNTLAEVVATKEELEQQSTALQEAKESLKEKEQSILSSIQEAKEKIDTANSQLDENENSMEEQEAAQQKLKDQIAKMEAYEKQLEEKRAREEAIQLKEQARLEEIKKQEEEAAANRKPVSATVSEEELLAAIIYCESGGEPYVSQLAVGSVVLNRVNSSYFPNTITEVIYQKNQFSPAGSGKLALVLENGLTTDSCRKAAKEVLAGNITGNWLYFRLDNGMIDGTIIGKQVFY
ncbi:MAG: cell wall hydrolase [Agathobacter sp.]|nr:cell wall hydrolase [Agathobacter sp.]